MQQCLPHPTGHPNTPQPRSQASFPTARQGQQPQTLQSPPQGCNQGFWEETPVTEATINSTFCLLFLINKFCILLVMLPSEKLYMWYTLSVTHHVLHRFMFFHSLSVTIFTPLPMSPELGDKVTRSCSYTGPLPHTPQATAFPSPFSHSWCHHLKIQLSHDEAEAL